MDDIAARLTKCFGCVFSDLTPPQICAASPRTVDRWDSLNHITLLTVIGEEFGIDVDYEKFSELDSYDALLEHLRHLPT